MHLSDILLAFSLSHVVKIRQNIIRYDIFKRICSSKLRKSLVLASDVITALCDLLLQRDPLVMLSKGSVTSVSGH